MIRQGLPDVSSKTDDEKDVSSTDVPSKGTLLRKGHFVGRGVSTKDGYSSKETFLRKTFLRTSSSLDENLCFESLRTKHSDAIGGKLLKKSCYSL